MSCHGCGYKSKPHPSINYHIVISGRWDYELYLRFDLYTRKHTQWFYFSIQNMRAGQTYRFTIVNLYKVKYKRWRIFNLLSLSLPPPPCSPVVFTMRVCSHYATLRKKLNCTKLVGDVSVLTSNTSKLISGNVPPHPSHFNHTSFIDA